MNEIEISKLALLISFSSLFIAGISIGWNIFTHYFSKPRLTVKFVSYLVVPGPIKKTTGLSIGNYGPDDITISTVVLRKRHILPRRKKYIRYGYVQIGMLEINKKPPYKLKKGDRKFIYIEPSDDILNDKYNQIGIIDYYNRYKWAPVKDYKNALKSFREDQK